MLSFGRTMQKNEGEHSCCYYYIEYENITLTIGYYSV